MDRRVGPALLAIAILLGGCGASDSDGRSDPKPLPDSVPTRPIGEPLVFRLDGRSDPADVARYSVHWKLNRDPIGKVPGREGDYVAGSRGNYGIEGWDLAEFHGVSAGPKPGCFGASVQEGYPETLRPLDRIPVGGRVTVDLAPLTPSGVKGQSKLGRNYTFHVRMRTADVRLRSAAAKRQLATIGC
jgi:hypothetical protein